MIADSTSGLFFAFTALTLLLLSACSFAPGEIAVRPPAPPSTRSNGFTNFETEPVRPLMLSADGRYLFALNTADDHLEIFDAQGETLRSIGETSVGLRPVALALQRQRSLGRQSSLRLHKRRGR
jgi:hypothetical protein